MEKTYIQILSSEKQQHRECDDGCVIEISEQRCDNSKYSKCHEPTKRDDDKIIGAGSIASRRSAIDFDSRSRKQSSSYVFPSPHERKIYEAICCGNRRNYFERWRGEWGRKPQGFREGRDYHYWWWRKTYIDYLRIIYEKIIKKMKTYKEVSFRKINLEEFIELAYINSSGYITQYT